MYRRLLKIGAMVLTAVVLLSACKEPIIGTEQTIYEGKNAGYEGQCIDADDFGYPKSVLIYSDPSDPNEILGEKYDQTTYWVNTGLEATGDDLLVKTAGKWTSWFDGTFSSKDVDDKYCIVDWDEAEAIASCPLIDTALYNGGGYDNWAIYSNVNDSNFNTPCWFTHGYAGYTAFLPPGVDPNFRDSVSGIGDRLKILYPPAHIPTLHMFGWIDHSCGSGVYSGYSGEYCGGTYGTDISLTEMYQPLPVSAGGIAAEEGDMIWARILDRYYEDNNGQYVFIFKML